MGADVHRAIMDVLEKEGGMDPAEAKKFFQAMHKDGRYVQELWS